jgi:hypothetical protein
MESSPTIGDYVRSTSRAFPANARSVTYISDWNRKNANTLLDGLLRHFKRTDGEVVQIARLASVRADLELASKSVRTDSVKLSQYRSAVCKECREHSLYACDVPSGWSSNCAFIAENP